MRFQVPQFIEIEDKIFGPLTFKQFVYLIGGAGICVTLFFTTPKIIAYPLIAGIAALSFALAFYKVNNKPFIVVMLSAISFFFGSRLYVWKRPEPKKIEKKEAAKDFDVLSLPKLPEGRLRDTAWNLGVNNSIYATQETQRQVRTKEMLEFESSTTQNTETSDKRPLAQTGEIKSHPESE